jgi:hypothetical protein
MNMVKESPPHKHHLEPLYTTTDRQDWEFVFPLAPETAA